MNTLHLIIIISSVFGAMLLLLLVLIIIVAKLFKHKKQDSAKLNELNEKMVQNNFKINENNENVNKLSSVFSNSNEKGKIGEYFLENILKSFFGTNVNLWESQYKMFNESEKKEYIIDAIIKTTNKNSLIGIDSKFIALDKYKLFFETKDNTQKKKHKDAIISKILQTADSLQKYINSTNKLDYVLMFLPSDALYNFYVEILDEKKLMGSLFHKKIFLTSPSTLGPILLLVLKFTNMSSLPKNNWEFYSELEGVLTSKDSLTKEFYDLKKDFNKRSKNIETIINYIENAGNNLKEFYEDNLNVKSGQRKKFTNNKKVFKNKETITKPLNKNETNVKTELPLVEKKVVTEKVEPVNVELTNQKVKSKNNTIKNNTIKNNTIKNNTIKNNTIKNNTNTNHKNNVNSKNKTNKNETNVKTELPLVEKKVVTEKVESVKVGLTNQKVKSKNDTIKNNTNTNHKNNVNSKNKINKNETNNNNKNINITKNKIDNNQKDISQFSNASNLKKVVWEKETIIEK